jgi:hypothetical protein
MNYITSKPYIMPTDPLLVWPRPERASGPALVQNATKTRTVLVLPEKGVHRFDPTDRRVAIGRPAL